MSAISLKSITGITSITTPAGVDNQLTLHTNDKTQRVKVTESGIEVVGVATFQDIDVDGHTNLDNVSIAGVTTMTGNLSMGETLTVSGNNPNLTFTDTNSNPDFKIYGSNGTFSILDSTNSVNRFVINSIGNISISNDLDVDGHTNLDHVSISGITTFTNGFVDFKPGNGGNAHFRILSTGSGEAGIFFDAANGDIAGSDYVFIGQKNNLDFVINPNANAGNIDFQRAGTTQLRINSSGKVIIGNSGTPFGNGAVQAFIQHGNTAGESGFSSVDTTSVAQGVGGEIAFHGKYNTGAQDWAYFGHIRGIKENATNGNTACALTFHTRPNATAPQERLRITSDGKLLINSSTVTASYGGKLQVTNSNFAMNSFANNQHAQTLLFAKSRATSGSGGTIVGSGDFCGHIEWYADDGENTENQIAKISGQMDGSPGVNDTPGKLLFYTTADGANTSTLRMQISNGGVMHIGSTAVSNTIPTGGLDLQGNNTNCILEMGNPLPNYSAGRVPTFRITTRDADKAVDLSSMWGGTNGIYKHITMAGGATIFYNGTNDTEIVRITGSALMVGTTSNSANTQAKGIALGDDGSMVSRRDGVMHYYKSIATGGYYANVFMSANTTVGSIFFNSGGTQFNTSSDYRRKENVVSLTDGITKLKQLKPYRFNFKDNPSVTVDGFLAHEAQEIVPHTVTGTKDQVSTSNDVAVGIASTVGEPIYQQMDLSKLVPLLTAALQDEISKREALEARVAALESS